jgi:hypothetical protein
MESVSARNQGFGYLLRPRSRIWVLRYKDNPKLGL